MRKYANDNENGESRRNFALERDLMLSQVGTAKRTNQDGDYRYKDVDQLWMAESRRGCSPALAQHGKSRKKKGGALLLYRCKQNRTKSSDFSLWIAYKTESVSQ